MHLRIALSVAVALSIGDVAAHQRAASGLEAESVRWSYDRGQCELVLRATWKGRETYSGQLRAFLPPLAHLEKPIVDAVELEPGTTWQRRYRWSMDTQRAPSVRTICVRPWPPRDESDWALRIDVWVPGWSVFYRDGFERRRTSQDGWRLRVRRGEAPRGSRWVEAQPIENGGARSLRLFPSKKVPAGTHVNLARHRYLRFWARTNGVEDRKVALSAVSGSTRVSTEVELRAGRDDGWGLNQLDLVQLFGASGVPDGGDVTEISLRVPFLRDGQGHLELDEVVLAASEREASDWQVQSLVDRYLSGRLSVEQREQLRTEMDALSNEPLSRGARVDAEVLKALLVIDANPDVRGDGPVGQERFAFLLRHRHGIDKTPLELSAIGREWLERTYAEMEVLADEIALRHKLEIDGAVLPFVRDWITRTFAPKDADEQIDNARLEMNAARDFVVDHFFVGIPSGYLGSDLAIHREGRISRTYPFGGYGGSVRRDGEPVGRYLVTPPADWMTGEEKRMRLRGNSRPWTRVVALHEVFPGHHLQTLYVDEELSNPLRRRLYSTVFAEGWALYCEHAMLRAGYMKDPVVRFCQAWMRLWRAARVMIDVGLQTGTMEEAAARAMLVERVGLNKENAQAEVLRYRDNPTRPLSYLIGWLEIESMERLARERWEDYQPKLFRERLLMCGPIPLRLARLQLGLD